MRVFNPKTAVSLFCACTAFCRAAEETFSTPSFDTYQPIIDRMPFGALPANFGQEPVNTAPDQSAMLAQAEQQKLAAQVNVSAVNITPDGQTAVGFTDLAAKPPANYFLRVGASADGWTVVSADFDAETVSLLKDGVTLPLRLGKGNLDLSSPPVKPPAAGSVPPASPAAALGHTDRGQGGVFRRFPSLMGGAPATPAGLIRAPGRVAADPAASPATETGGEERSYAARLHERLTQKTAEQQAAEQRRKAELEKLVDAAAQKALRREVEDAQAAAAAAPLPEEQPAAPIADPQQEQRPPAEGALE